MNSDLWPPPALSSLVNKNKQIRFGIVGLGVTGQAMAKYLEKFRQKFVLIDSNEQATFRLEGIETRLGALSEQSFVGLEVLCLSPGVDRRLECLQQARAKGVILLGELELIGKMPVPTIAVTGTNGKSTTVKLIHDILRFLGKNPFLGGNFGRPVLDWLASDDEVHDCAVLELSSFQLEEVEHFAADVSAILNFSPDHGERYDDFNSYIQAKLQMIVPMNASCHFVGCLSDVILRDFFISSTNTLVKPYKKLLEENHVKCWPVSDVSCIQSEKTHPDNIATALTCIEALLGKEVVESNWDSIQEAVKRFEPLKNRIEKVGEKQGRVLINDSKATNDASAAVGVLSQQCPVVWLVGGVSKSGGYMQMIEAAKHSKIRALVGFGQSGEEILVAFKESGVLEEEKYSYFPTLKQALPNAWVLSEPGDVILLSPGGSSFDEFQNYVKRGDFFRQWAQSLSS